MSFFFPAGLPISNCPSRFVLKRTPSKDSFRDLPVRNRPWRFALGELQDPTSLTGMLLRAYLQGISFKGLPRDSHLCHQNLLLGSCFKRLSLRICPWRFPQGIVLRDHDVFLRDCPWVLCPQGIVRKAFPLRNRDIIYPVGIFLRECSWGIFFEGHCYP